MSNRLPENWASIPVEDAVENISTTGKKTPQKKYLESGRFPIVDQGQQLIGGYTDDESNIVDCEPPAIVFGDHTKVVKLVKPKKMSRAGMRRQQPVG